METLGEIKEYLTENFIGFTPKKTSVSYYDWNLYEVVALEAVGDDIQKRQFRLWVKGITDEDEARFDKNMRPQKPPSGTVEPSLNDKIETYLNEQGILWFDIVGIKNDRALVNVITAAQEKKTLLLREAEEGITSTEIT